MASMARFTSERVPGYAPLAICQRVSLAWTRYVEPGSILGAAALPLEGARSSAALVLGARSSAGGGTYVSAGAGRGAAVVARGVATGASATAGPGAYTGGSSSTVYSRSNRPRGQLASMRKVTNGSVTGLGEVTRRTSRPLESRSTAKVNSDR